MSAIEVKNLKKHFGKVKAVDGISFNVEKGEIYGFLGPNGAGKTTVIRCLMDFLRPDEGKSKILGLDAQENSVELKNKIGYLSPDERLYRGWTGNEHVDFVRSLRGNSKRAKIIAKQLDLDLSIKAWKLSSGNKQKLSLVLSMMSDPEILIMDEPTLGLDPLLQNKIYQILDKLQERGKTIFMSSHNLPEVEKICTKVAIIREGKIVATESISDLRSKRMYGIYAVFADEFRVSDFESLDIEVIDEDKNSLRFTAKGDINPLLKKLNEYRLKDLEIKRASLEEIFLEFYK